MRKHIKYFFLVDVGAKGTCKQSKPKIELCLPGSLSMPIDNHFVVPLHNTFKYICIVFTWQTSTNGFF